MRFTGFIRGWLLLIASIAAWSVHAEALPKQARVVVMEKAGDAYRWKITTAPVPTINEDQVLVHIRAVSLNRGDVDRLKPRAGEDKTGRLPITDAAGDVVAVGKQVKTLVKGARVATTYFNDWIDGPFSSARLEHVPGWTTDGYLADYIAIDASAVVPIPNEMSVEEASTLPTAGLTAWNAVNAHPEFHADSVVLIQGTGGVSTFAMQFALAKGAQVIVTSSSDDKLKRARALGARDGINYRTQPNWSESVLKLTQGHGADLIVDIGGKNTLEQSTLSLADNGTLAIVGGLTGYDGSISAWGLLKKQARAQSVFVGSHADFQRMTAFMVARRLRPVIEKVYPLEEYEAALKHLDSGDFVGKIVLKL